MSKCHNGIMLVNCVVAYLVKRDIDMKRLEERVGESAVNTGSPGSLLAAAQEFAGFAGLSELFRESKSRISISPKQAVEFAYRDVALEHIELVPISATDAVMIVALEVTGDHPIKRIDLIRRPNTDQIRVALESFGFTASVTDMTYATTISSHFNSNSATEDGWLIATTEDQMKWLQIGISIELTLLVTVERMILDRIARDVVKGNLTYRKSAESLRQLDRWVSVLSSDSTWLVDAHQELRNSLHLAQRRADILETLRHFDRRSELRTAGSLGLAATIGTVFSNIPSGTLSGWPVVGVSIASGIAFYVFHSRLTR
jgi:hypothetical protein